MNAINTLSTINTSRGKFISFEGIDGSGKSTHISLVANLLHPLLTSVNKKLVVTREPGGTALGEQVRSLVLSYSMHAETEALLMFAARREHLAQVIIPVLENGDWILSDRFIDASFAYQGGGRGLAQHKLTQLEHWIMPLHFMPDLTLLFDLSPEVAYQRLHILGNLDKFEQEPLAFFERVRAHYLVRAQQAIGRIYLVDAEQEKNQVQKAIEVALRPLINALLG